MIKKSIGMMVVLITLGLLLACAAPAEVSPTLVISPASAPGTTPITLLGTGFQPGEMVQVTITVGGVICVMGRKGAEGVVRAEADQDGAFMFPSFVPHSNYADPGVYIATATGDKGSVAIFPLGVEAKK